MAELIRTTQHPLVSSLVTLLDEKLGGSYEGLQIGLLLTSRKNMPSYRIEHLSEDECPHVRASFGIGTCLPLDMGSPDFLTSWGERFLEILGETPQGRLFVPHIGYWSLDVDLAIGESLEEWEAPDFPDQIITPKEVRASSDDDLDSSISLYIRLLI